MTTQTLSYTPIEVRSYLPGGWSLVEATGLVDHVDQADHKTERGWSVLVADGADVEWTLEVKADAAHKLGRTEALRQAVDRLYREALG